MKKKKYYTLSYYDYSCFKPIQVATVFKRRWFIDKPIKSYEGKTAAANANRLCNKLNKEYYDTHK